VRQQWDCETVSLSHGSLRGSETDKYIGLLGLECLSHNLTVLRPPRVHGIIPPPIPIMLDSNVSTYVICNYMEDLMVRQTMTISIPADLHERLAKYKENLNVSGICQVALIDRINELESRKRSKATMTVVERLKQERKNFVNESYRAGQEAFDSDLEHTSYAQLIGLVKVTEEGREGAGYNLYDSLLEITGLSAGDWEDTLEGQDVEAFCRGYFDRAAERWRTELRDQIED